jgi:hypothetical protein
MYEYKDLIIDLLAGMFQDMETQWISYFCYELDFGYEWKEGCVTENGKDIPLKNASDLYDILINNMKARGEKNGL